MFFVQDPRPGTDTHIKIRLGSHSGQVLKNYKYAVGYNINIIENSLDTCFIQVVGGIVGNKCPR